ALQTNGSIYWADKIGRGEYVGNSFSSSARPGTLNRNCGDLVSFWGGWPGQAARAAPAYSPRTKTSQDLSPGLFLAGTAAFCPRGAGPHLHQVGADFGYPT